MPDRFVSILLRLYPEEFRERFGPQIEADLYHPGTNVAFAVMDILRSAIYHRATSPGPYVWLAAIAGALVIITVSATITLQGAHRVLPAKIDSQVQLYALLFLAVFLVLLSVLLLAVNWLQKCSKLKA